MRLRRAAVPAGDGTRLAVVTTSWGPAPRPGVVTMHATGLCKEVWEPFVVALADLVPAATVTGIDQRGHGDSGPLRVPSDWWRLGADVLEVVAAVPGPGPSVGVGHSAGATAMAMAEILRPGTFSALVLAEPILPPPPFRRAESHPLIDGARRRHDTFPDRGSARAEWAGKPAFSRWHPDALDAYARHGLVPSGEAMVLKCTRETEAECYAAGFAHGAVARVGEIACPVVLVAGGDSDAPGPAPMKALVGKFRQARVAVIPRGSHFLPMEQPDAVASVVGDFLRST